MNYETSPVDPSVINSPVNTQSCFVCSPYAAQHTGYLEILRMFGMTRPDCDVSLSRHLQELHNVTALMPNFLSV